MNTKKTFALGFATLLLASASFAQQTTAPVTTTTTTMNRSIGDYSGVLGVNYGEASFTFHNLRDTEDDAFDASVKGFVPLAPGFDLGLGYNYFWADDRANPVLVGEEQFLFDTGDLRLHTVMLEPRLFAPNSRWGAKPFVSPMVGYQWSSGNFSDFVTYDEQWVWGGSAGIELPVGRTMALTPQATFTDLTRSGTRGAWHYGADLHTWLNEFVGLRLNATYHDPQSGGGPNHWSYTGALRYRF